MNRFYAIVMLLMLSGQLLRAGLFTGPGVLSWRDSNQLQDVVSFDLSGFHFQNTADGVVFGGVIHGTFTNAPHFGGGIDLQIDRPIREVPDITLKALSTVASQGSGNVVISNVIVHSMGFTFAGGELFGCDTVAVVNASPSEIPCTSLFASTHRAFLEFYLSGEGSGSFLIELGDNTAAEAFEGAVPEPTSFILTIPPLAALLYLRRRVRIPQQFDSLPRTPLN